MSYDAERKEIRVSYPFTAEAVVQPDNYKQVRAIQENIERRIYAKGLDKEYSAEMQRMLDAGSITKMSDSERKVTENGIHYMPQSTRSRSLPS